MNEEAERQRQLYIQQLQRQLQETQNRNDELELENLLYELQSMDDDY